MYRDQLEIPLSRIDWQFSIANRAAWGISVIVVGACLLPNVPSWLLFLVSMIVAAVTIVSSRFRRDALSPEVAKANTNAGLVVLTSFLPQVLVLKTLFRFEILDWFWPLVVAIVIGLPATFVRLRSLPSMSSGRVGTIGLALFLAYTGTGSLIWSAILFANDMGQPALVADHRVVISAKHEQRGKNYTEHWINAANPPDLKGIRDFSLDRATYETLAVGGNACIEVWRGALSLRWYRVTACGAAGER